MDTSYLKLICVDNARGLWALVKREPEALPGKMFKQLLTGGS